MAGFNMKNAVMMFPNSFGGGMDISDRSDKSFQSRIFRSSHPKVRVRFRMPPPESLMSSGGTAQREGWAFAFSWGVFGRQPAAVRGCRLVFECGLVQGWGVGGSGLHDVALGVCENLCGNACHPVIAISVVPKLVTNQAVWMPGL